jgi:MYXO-CTERM domain-containing protein
VTYEVCDGVTPITAVAEVAPATNVSAFVPAVKVDRVPLCAAVIVTVAVATTASDNPGYAAYGTYANFVGAIDDSATFSTITFYGDGFGEYLVAGGVIRYGTVRTGSVTGVPEHSSPVTLVAVGLGLAGLGVLRRRRQFSKLDAYLNSNQN